MHQYTLCYTIATAVFLTNFSAFLRTFLCGIFTPVYFIFHKKLNRSGLTHRSILEVVALQQNSAEHKGFMKELPHIQLK